jgi:hypothetical protein
MARTIQYWPPRNAAPAPASASVASGDGQRQVSKGMRPKLDRVTAVVDVNTMARVGTSAPSRRVIRSLAAMKATDSSASIA